ncbi:hypothetical protein BO85DRAFT_266247 [Aspergillus piperis CBS 112811]|uniref:Uncharacterized protein n=1 Tax=Aspergillus piperis CBS 112811 TaxID=1448313 RepID=A0A8G1R7N2_9EURO|nr:hypothetical protein BO85DRAFT_266247 [Aspergillus piperis CBS 112811]RAH59235.1 hypothetical protein BO85DRAFT_266247 [Aspergillus piperis CBS 112811]
MVWQKLLHRTRCMKHGALKQRLDSWLLFFMSWYMRLISWHPTVALWGWRDAIYWDQKISYIWNRVPMVLELAHW